MSKIFTVLLLIFSVSSFGQDVIDFGTFNGPGENRIFKSVIDNQNNIYLVGYFSGTVTAGIDYTANGSGYDIYVSKYDSDGNLLWFKQIGSSNQDDFVDAVTLSPDGSMIYIAGGYYGSSIDFGNGFTLSNTDTGTSDAYIASLNTANGNIISANTLASGIGSQRPQSMKFDKNSNLVIIGYIHGDTNITYFDPSTFITCNGPQNYFILKLNTSLNVIWVKHIIGNNATNKLYSIDVDESGYYIAGTNKNTLNLDNTILNSISGTTDMFLYKTDFNGNEKWVRSIKGSGNESSVYVTSDQNGHIYISGYYASTDLKVDSTATLQSTRTITNKGSNDIFFAKYDTTGTLNWFDVAGSTGDDRLTRLSTFNGYIVLAGQYSGSMTIGQQTITPQGGTDAFGVVHDENDNPLYAISAGGSGTDLFQTCVIDNTGNYFFIGQGNSPTTYFTPTQYLTNATPTTRDVFIAKYNKASISIVKSEITCPGSNNGVANAVPKGALVEPVSYQWSKKGDATFTKTSANITSLSSGRYYVTATDAVNYSLVDSVDFVDPAPVSVALTAAQTYVTCNNGNNGAIDITVSGGATPYTYAWTTVGGTGINAIAEDQTTLTAGQYSVEVTDKNGCKGNLNNIVITQPDKITYAGTLVTKINGALGAVNLSVQGGTAGYTYSWAGPSGFTATTEDISNLTSAGNYIVTVTDANSCLSDTTVFIADSHVLNAYLGSKQNVKCKGGSTGSITIATENVTGTATYTWSPVVSTTETAVNLGAGNYSVTVADGSSNTAVVNVTISQPASDLTISVAKSNITCNNRNNGVLDANAAGGTLPYTYNWTKDAQPFDGGNETQINLSEGAYAVTVTDANNCTASTTQSIANPGAITFTGTPNPVTCEDGKNDGSIVLSNIQGGTGSYTFFWSNGQITQNATLLAANTYWVTVTDDNNCSNSNSYIIDYASPIIIDILPTNITCNGAGNGILNASVSGGHPGFTYAWSTGGTTQSISGLVPNTYTVTVTDSKLCVKSKSAVLTDPPVLTIASSNQSNVACYNGSTGSITVTPGGGTPNYSYSWDQGAGSLATASGLPAGNYNVTVTDANNCTTTGAYTITQPSALGISEDVNAHTDATCYGTSTGSLTLIPSGGSGNYEYSLNSGTWGSNSVFSGLTAGTYSYAVRDANAITCSLAPAQTITITQPNALSVAEDANSHLNATCNGLANGSFTLQPSGGSGSYEYSVNGGNWSATATFTSLPVGNYSYVCRDANATTCSVSSSQDVVITEPQALSIVLEASVKATSNNPWNGSVSISVNGGTSPFTFTLDGTSVQQALGDFLGLAPGLYTVSVNDANNCGAVTSSVLTVSDATSVTEVNGDIVKVYPIPAKDYIYIEYNNSTIKTVSLALYSQTGKLVFTDNVPVEAMKSQQYRIDISQLVKGVYILKLNGNLVTEKIVVQ